MSRPQLLDHSSWASVLPFSIPQLCDLILAKILSADLTGPPSDPIKVTLLSSCLFKLWRGRTDDQKFGCISRSLDNLIWHLSLWRLTFPPSFHTTRLFYLSNSISSKFLSLSLSWSWVSHWLEFSWLLSGLAKDTKSVSKPFDNLGAALDWVYYACKKLSKVIVQGQ